ncbi:MAG: metal ABC transporter permease [Euzebyaceae bacterium]|nr:metal ABC transporter permease [Euzebyaceae bacterium]
MQQALVACLLIAAVAPLVGTFIVQRGQSLVGDGMGHVAFAGVGRPSWSAFTRSSARSPSPCSPGSRCTACSAAASAGTSRSR